MKRPLLLLCALSLLSACSPSPKDVCNHMADLIKKKAGSDPAVQATALKAADMGDCQFNMSHRKDMKGVFKWRTSANCVMDAKTLQAAGKCP